MKVRAIMEVNEDKKYPAGTEFEVSDERGARLIELGMCEDCKAMHASPEDKGVRGRGRR